MIITGSTAVKYHLPSSREPKDLDVFYTEGQKIGEGVDGILVSKEVYEAVPFVEYNNQKFATLDTIYTIKLSHLTWNKVGWEKHKSDVLFLKKVVGCKVIRPLWELLLEFWSKTEGNKEFLSLKQSKDDFFTDNVEYKYDHDYLHELVSSPYEPVYKSLLKEGEEVLIDKSKFLKLDKKGMVKLFREEITTIALERWYLTDYWFDRNITFEKSYSLALEKTILNLTKGWATEFIVMNLEEFVKPDKEVAKKVLKLLKLEEKYMSNVDLTVFNEAYESELVDSENYSLESFIYYMCEGDSDFIRYGGDWDTYKKSQQEFLEKFDYEHLDQDGGGEGGSEDCYGVFRFMGKIYKAYYNYYSYHGYEYDGITENLKEVKPVQKTVTVYE